VESAVCPLEAEGVGQQHTDAVFQQPLLCFVPCRALSLSASSTNLSCDIKVLLRQDFFCYLIRKTTLPDFFRTIFLLALIFSEVL
jgi:hypothetical protein